MSGQLFSISAPIKTLLFQIVARHLHKLGDGVAGSTGIGTSAEQGKALGLALVPVHLRCLQTVSKATLYYLQLHQHSLQGLPRLAAPHIQVGT